MGERDSITGLWGLRPFRELVGRHIRAAGRQADPFCLLGLNIDRFRYFNYVFGYLAGNAALGGVATVLRAHFAVADPHDPDKHLCYAGSGSFFAFAPQVALPAALEAAERLRQAALPFEVGQPYVAEPVRSMTFSIGVVAYPDDGPALDALFTAVDRAVLAAKLVGGDAVRLAS